MGNALNCGCGHHGPGNKMLASAGAARDEPRELDWSHADASKWEYPECEYGGQMSYFKDPVFVEGVELDKGLALLKSHPDAYDGIIYQTSMTDWPVDQQKYKLVKRTGAGFSVKGKSRGAGFTYIEAKYQALPSDVDVAPDEYTDSVLDNFQGQKLGTPMMPGRGQGCVDNPGLKIIGDVDPNDVAQGGVGDCWMLSAISGLAEFDGAVSKLFRNEIDEMPHDEFNTYTIRLWDLSQKPWQEVDIVVDERLCSKPDGHSLLGNTASVDGELWVCYLEKALAAHCGGWDKIDGGQPVHAWRMLTGCEDQYTFRDDDGDGFACMGCPDNDTLENSPHDGSQSLHYIDWPEVGGGGDERHKCEHDEMFEKMVAWDNQNYIIGAGTCSGSDSEDHQGIVDGHAYSVLRCVSVGGFDLLKVRNPWGKGEYKSGMWDDDGPGWEQHPEVKEKLKPVNADNGVFWVDKDEFFKYFSTVYLCAHDMGEFLKD